MGGNSACGFLWPILVVVDTLTTVGNNFSARFSNVVGAAMACSGAALCAGCPCALTNGAAIKAVAIAMEETVRDIFLKDVFFMVVPIDVVGGGGY